MDKECGIDFGTSNSSIGYTKASKTELTKFDNNIYIPSSIFFDFDSSKCFFGKDAIDRYIDGYDGRIMWSPKNALGTPLINETTLVKNKKYSFQDVIQLILANLKRECEKQSGQEKTQIVCGRPVFFNDNDPYLDRLAQNALRDILGKIGFKDIEFEFEPIAAAVDFERKITREHIALIVDMGGGTSDFSVIKLVPNGLKKSSRQDDILSVGGVHIAGTDFDRLLSLRQVMPELGSNGTYKSMEGKWLPLASSIYHDLASWHKINFVYTHHNISTIAGKVLNSDVPIQLERLLYVLKHRYGHYLASLVEKAKIDLSSSEAAIISSNEIKPELNKSISREEFNKAIVEHVDRIGETLNATIVNSGLNPDKVDVVFMTGGSSMIPIVREKIHSIVQKAKVVEGDKFGSVATGLTAVATEIFK
jgi:hypothetical chaperone protein